MNQMATRPVRFYRLVNQIACFRGLIGLVCVLSLTTAARSQTPLVSFDKVFDQFNGIAVWGSISPATWHHRDVEARKFLGLPDVPLRYGFELLLGPYPAKESNRILDSLKHLRNSWIVSGYAHSPDAPSVKSFHARIGLLPDSTSTADSLKPERRKDSLALLNYAIKLLETRDSIDEAKKVQFECGFGLDYSDSYRNISNSLDMRIPIRGYYLSAYVEPPLKILGEWSVYLGSVIGFYSISDGILFKADTSQNSVGGSSIGLELIVGLSKRWGPIQLQMELGYQYLAFDGVQYGGTVLPSNSAPRRIDLSGVYITLALQGAKKQ